MTSRQYIKIANDINNQINKGIKLVFIIIKDNISSHIGDKTIKFIKI